MTKNNVSKSLIALTSALSIGVLAGCSNGTTYGTGVSQEAQLASDVGGLFLLSSGKKKKNINYSSRPKLVKAPATGNLPAPAETVEGGAAYFPTNPEEARLKRISDAPVADARSGNLPDGDNTRVRDSGTGPAISKSRKSFRNEDHEETADQARATNLNGSARRLARANDIRNQERGLAPRKYLTQPPVEYRKPAESADTGNTGEKEYGPNEERKTGIFDRWTSKKKSRDD
ncbi:MAG: hypothetical protein V3V02_11605 [Rhizobiaceae bacterium]